MAVEPKRGCGYRQAGGLYLVTTGLGEPCERLPVPLEICHHCGEGIKQSRGFRWMTLEAILAGARPCAMSSDKAQKFGTLHRDHCPRCIICTPGILEATSEPKDKVGLLWIGGKFYPTPQAWSQEAAKMGVSRRIAGIPKGLVIGKTWIMVAHPEAIRVPKEGSKDPSDLFDDDKVDLKPGVFHAFRPQRLELVVTPSMEKEDWVKKLVDKQGVTLVRVPENDPDHAPRQSKKSARKAAMDRVAQKAAKAQKKKPGQEPPLRRAQ